MVSSLVQTKWFVFGGMIAMLPGVNARVLVASKLALAHFGFDRRRHHRMLP
jgi:hypothetical protein